MSGTAVKLTGAVMIFAVCVYVGFSTSDRMKKRCVYLRNIQAALGLLETEIVFGGSRLKEAFISLDSAVDTRGLFIYAAEQMTELGIKRAWRAAVEKKRDELRFTNSDAEVLTTLGEQLGRTDAENQKKHINYVKKQLEAHTEQAEGEYDRLGKLYRSGGILFGLFLILILT